MPMFILFVFMFYLFPYACLLLLFEIHDYNLFVKMLNFVFNFVLTTYKGILQKISVRDIQIGLLE